MPTPLLQAVSKGPNERQSLIQKLETIQASLTPQTLAQVYQHLQRNDIHFRCPPSRTTITSVPSNYLALDAQNPKNRIVVAHEEVLVRNLRFLSSLTSPRDATIQSQVDACQALLEKEKTFFLDWKRRDWKRQERVAHESLVVDPAIYMDSPLKSFPPDVALIYLMVLSGHYLCGLSFKQCDYLLSGLALLKKVSSPEAPLTLPHTARTIINQLALAPKFSSYACCPTCFSLHSLESQYPQHCLHHAAPDQPPCNTQLFENNRQDPHRIYVMQDFEDWLARLFARPEMEDFLDRKVSSAQAGVVQDIWEAPALQDFRGPDGNFFLECSPGESHLIFSMNMDGFNPLTNKQGGKQISCSAIYMACLNLPPCLRYRPENIYLVGVVPGPQEPTVSQINNVLRPLVNVLVNLWDPGLYLHRTSRHPFGRRCQIAVIPLVTDLLAGKKVAGFGSHTCTHFCSCCHTTLKDMDDIDYRAWTPRCLADHRKAAEEWRDASNLKEQGIIFNKSGVRWSELLRLPYWDPTKFVIIDSMHCFYLGLLHHHVLKVWGMQENAPNGPGATYNALVKKPPTSDLERARRNLELGEFQFLESTSKLVLMHLCYEKKLRYAARSKLVLVNRLKQWREKDVLRATPSTGPVSIPNVSYFNHSLSFQPAVPVLPALGVQVNDKPLSAPSSRSHSSPYNPSLPPLPLFSDHIPSSFSVPPIPSVLSTPLEHQAPALSAKEIEEHWVYSYHSTIMRLNRLQLHCLIMAKSPSSQITSEAQKLTLVNEVQRLRKAAGLISGDKNQPVAKRPLTHVKTSRMTSPEEVAQASITPQPTLFQRDFSFVHEFTTIGAMELENELSGPQQQAKHAKKEKHTPVEHKNHTGAGKTCFPPLPKKETCVLGKDLITEIKRDMSRVTLPSWVPRGPKYPGSTKQGKLHADQWRSFCTINLVVTLVRVWGTEGAGSNKVQELKNFLHLIMAIKYATLRTIDDEVINAYETHMLSYLKSLLDLYPGTELVLNQHMALHFGEHLRRFGPTHGWRCFAFERFNNLLQQVQTNNIQSQMEKTMFTSFCLTQRIRELFQPSQIPRAIHPILNSFQNAFENDTRGTFMSEDIILEIEADKASEEQMVSGETYKLLLDWYHWHSPSTTNIPRTATFLPSISSDVIYKTAKRSLSDSYIMFRLKNESRIGHWAAGSITTILLHGKKHRTTFLVIEPFRPAVPCTNHPFVFHDGSEFSFCIGRLFHVRNRPALLLISLDQVIGHFGYAETDYGDAEEPLFHAVPLEK